MNSTINTYDIANVSEPNLPNYPVRQNTSDNTLLYVIIFGPIWFVIGVFIFHFVAFMIFDVCHMGKWIMSYCAAEDLNERHNSEFNTDEGKQLCVLTSERAI